MLPVHTFSPAMQRVYDAGARAAASEACILILGEPGVGKAVMAERLHELSPRAGKEMVSFNCVAARGGRFCELFGCEEGSLSAAIPEKPALLEVAEGSTVFVDDVGSLELRNQVVLSRAIETKSVCRTGGVEPRQIDVRLIAATGEDLEVAIAKGTFRRDLFDQLREVTLVIPPLRERLSEIPELARTFVAWQCQGVGRQDVTISPSAMAILSGCRWHDNIRGLKLIVQRAVILCEGPEIGPEHLPSEIR